MGEKDSAEKLLENCKDVYADIINGFLYQGKAEVCQEELIDSVRRSQYKADSNVLHEQERDGLKYWERNNVRFAVFGIENQTQIDKYMPMRIIGYDGAEYRNMLKDRSKKKKACIMPVPVITLVLYFGKDHWDKRKTLKELMELPKELESYFNDYRINVFEVAWLTDDEIARFTSDFRIIADFFVQNRKNEEIRLGKEKIEHVDEVLKFLEVMSKDDRFGKISEEIRKTGRRPEYMCEMLDMIEKRGERRGEKRGERRGEKRGEKLGKRNGILLSIRNLMDSLGVTVERAMELLKIPQDEYEVYKSLYNNSVSKNI